jgi:hypothetical protein
MAGLRAAGALRATPCARLVVMPLILMDGVSMMSFMLATSYPTPHPHRRAASSPASHPGIRARARTGFLSCYAVILVRLYGQLPEDEQVLPPPCAPWLIASACFHLSARESVFCRQREGEKERKSRRGRDGVGVCGWEGVVGKKADAEHAASAMMRQAVRQIKLGDNFDNSGSTFAHTLPVRVLQERARDGGTPPGEGEMRCCWSKTRGSEGPGMLASALLHPRVEAAHPTPFLAPASARTRIACRLPPAACRLPPAACC